MSTFWSHASAVARKDLRAELRTGEVLFVIVPFGAVALLLTPLAVGVDTPLLERIGPGMYWMVVLLFGVLVALRQSSLDGRPQRDMQALLGVDPAARFTGQAAATGLLLLVFALVLGPVAAALYDPSPSGWGWLAALIPLVVTGLALLGTLAGAITGGLGARNSLVPLLVVPLAVPLLLAATQSLEGLRRGEGILGWLLLLVAMDLGLAVIGVLSARPLQETSR